MVSTCARAGPAAEMAAASATDSEKCFISFLLRPRPGVHGADLWQTGRLRAMEPAEGVHPAGKACSAAGEVCRTAVASSPGRRKSALRRAPNGRTEFLR